MKADVFHAYLSLLKQTRPAQSWLADPDAMEQGETPLTMLQSQVIDGSEGGQRRDVLEELFLMYLLSFCLYLLEFLSSCPVCYFLYG